MPGSVETTLTPPIGIIDPESQRSSVMVMVVVSPASIVTSVTEGTMLHDAMRSVARRKRKTYLGFIGVDTEPKPRSLVVIGSVDECIRNQSTPTSHPLP